MSAGNPLKARNNNSGVGLLTAAQVEKSCPVRLQDLGKRIAAHLAKAAQCDEKVEQHRISAGQLLAEAKKACDGGGFNAFREKFFPNLGKSRAYELLAIATNKKSVEETRADTRERTARSRANKKEAAANSATVAEKPTAAIRPEGDGSESTEASAAKLELAINKAADGQFEFYWDSEDREAYARPQAIKLADGFYEDIKAAVEELQKTVTAQMPTRTV
jgi:hypothetical protein